MFKKNVFLPLLCTAALSNDNVKVLNKNFLDTDVGTVVNHKLIREKKKIVKEKPEKTIIKQVKKIVKKVKQITVNEKKRYYIETMIPVITKVYKELQEKYTALKSDIEKNENIIYIEELKKIYKANSNEELLHAVKPHPISIVLAQGAIESAWLTSRFTKDANNIFGVWSFNKNEPRIAARGSRGQKTIFLKKYFSLEESVRDYYKSIAKSWAYKEFRYLRTITNDPFVLLPLMKSYSEKREVYTDTLAKMIRSNQFEKYDIKE